MRATSSGKNQSKHTRHPGKRGGGRHPERKAGEKPRILEKFLHHMAQPLTALHGTLEVALLPGNRRADLDHAIRAAINIAQSLVEDFSLLKEVIESGDPAHRAKRLRWSQLVRTAVANVSKKHPTNRVSVSIHDAARALVRADAALLLKATEDCIRLGLMLIPAEKQIEIELIKKESVLVLSVGRTLSDSRSSAGQHRNSEFLLDEEVRMWILRHNIESQGGSLRIRTSPGGLKSLSIQMRLAGDAKRERELNRSHHA